MSVQPRRLAAIAVATVFAAAAASAAVAAARGYTVRLNAADNAAARAATLKRSDFGSAAGWTGGATKPDLTSDLECSTYHPDLSGIVVTGAAASSFRNDMLGFDSQIGVVQTAAMTKRDFELSQAPGVVGCLREALERSLPNSDTIVSVGRVPFPHVATYSAAFRLVFEIAAKGQTVRIFSDAVVIVRGRTEIVLAATAPDAAKKSVVRAEIRLARLLAARARA